MSKYLNLTPERQADLKRSAKENPSELLVFMAFRLSQQSEHLADAYDPDEGTIDRDSGYDLFVESLSLREEADWVLECLGTSADELRKRWLESMLKKAEQADDARGEICEAARAHP